MEKVNTILLRCKICGNTFNGNFCNNCGEKVYDDYDKSLKHLFGEVLHFFTHFDTKFLKTLKLILFRPGYLSVQYCAGVRKPYFKPVSLFFVCVILYLLFPLFAGLNMQFGTYTSAKYGYTFFSGPLIKKKMYNHTLSMKELAKHYNETSPRFAKILLFLFLPLSAILLNGLFFKRKKPFFDHFILSTELNIFFVFIGFLVIPVIVYAIIKVWPGSATAFHDSGPVFKSLLLLYWLVFALAMKRFYNEKWGWIFLKSFVFVILYLFVIRFIYNLILFYLVMLFVH